LLRDYNEADNDDPAFEASFTPGRSGKFECRDGVKSAAKVRCALCSEFNTITGASAPPLLPSSCCSFVNRDHPCSKSWPDCAAPTGSTFAVRAWPRANAIPNRSLVHFDAPALSQLQLHKLFRAIEEHFTPEVWHVFDEHLTADGFPHLRRVQQDMDADFDAGTKNS
jgi:hypothetical protein